MNKIIGKYKLRDADSFIRYMAADTGSNNELYFDDDYIYIFDYIEEACVCNLKREDWELTITPTGVDIVSKDLCRVGKHTRSNIHFDFERTDIERYEPDWIFDEDIIAVNIYELIPGWIRHKFMTNHISGTMVIHKNGRDQYEFIDTASGIKFFKTGKKLQKAADTWNDGIMPVVSFEDDQVTLTVNENDIYHAKIISRDDEYYKWDLPWIMEE